MGRKILIIGLNWCLILITLCSAKAFAEPGREFTRLRSTPTGTPRDKAILSLDEPSVEYFIAPGDTIGIFIWQNPDLPQEVLIRPDGRFSYPMIGTIKAQGLTINKLEKVLKARLAKYIRSPQVTATVKASAGNKVIMMGQVNYPGVYTFQGTLDIFQLIALAGDFTDPPARRNGVIVVSDNLTEYPTVRRIDVLSGLYKGTSSEDYMIKPNDLVYVPRSRIGDFNKFLDLIQPTLSTLSSMFQTATNASTAFKEGRAWFLHRNVKIKQ